MVLQESKSAMTAISTNVTINSISQGHLNTWETCRRKYQYSFLEDLSLPEADLQRKKNLLLGANFHLLMQQQELGLDVSDLASSDPKLQLWLAAFEQQPPTMIEGDRLCEHRRTLEVAIQMSLHHSQNNNCRQGYFVLTAIYDFLILGDRQAQILDWKTHQVAIAKDKLQASWQTRLYLYLLVKTTNYLPKQLSMTYWFANTGESVVINYSEAEYRSTETKLEIILREISEATDYPLAVDISECKYCEFRDRCDRVDASKNTAPKNIAEIPEIEI
jgi:CRISPR/Cas system-associated exonuclease Cas4 (RecB family)